MNYYDYHGDHHGSPMDYQHHMGTRYRSYGYAAQPMAQFYPLENPSSTPLVYPSSDSTTLLWVLGIGVLLFMIARM